MFNSRAATARQISLTDACGETYEDETLATIVSESYTILYQSMEERSREVCVKIANDGSIMGPKYTSLGAFFKSLQPQLKEACKTALESFHRDQPSILKPTIAKIESTLENCLQEYQSQPYTDQSVFEAPQPSTEDEGDLKFKPFPRFVRKELRIDTKHDDPLWSTSYLEKYAALHCVLSLWLHKLSKKDQFWKELPGAFMESLAQKFGTSESTLRRYVKDIQENIPIRLKSKNEVNPRTLHSERFLVH